MFRIECIGNLGADCERKAEQGRTFFTFKVAHTEKWTNAQGQATEETIWVSCTMGENLGNAVAQYLTKGRKVFVRGRGRLNVYSSAKDRCMKAGISCHVDEVELLGGESDAIPRQLVNNETKELVNVYKAYFVSQDEVPKDKEGKPIFPVSLSSQQGKRFLVTDNGFITEQQNDNGQPM